MLQDFPFLNNNLFTSYTLEVDFPQIYDFESNKDQAKKALDSIKAIYNKEKFISQNEHQFEDDFISEVLEILGWSFIRQEEKIIQGKLEKPDFLLFTNQDSKNTYLQIPKEQRTANNEHFSVIAESKAYKVEIDNKKIKDNPHFQILRYLSNLKKDYGILTNGRIWRFYDNSKLSAAKIFYEIDLETILAMSNPYDESTLESRHQAESKSHILSQLQAFNYFYHIFHAKNFMQDSKDTSTISHILEKNAQSKTNIEDDLQSLIYGINGRDSLFEKIGACIYIANAESSLEQVYENALYFIFRLLFIAYFEDKFDEVLEKHSCFKQRISLYALLNEIQNNEIKQAKGSPKTTSHINHQAPKHKSYIGIARLEEIFRIYNEGNPNYDMPLFNGGLFDSTKTPLLATPKIFSDTDLIEILETLFYYTDSLNTYKRDYRTLSVAHLGTIYEGLLSYFFDKADEDIFYLVYAPKIRGKAKGKVKSQDIIEGYFDSYDYEKIAKTHTIHRIQNYKKGQIYLKNTSNSRKSTASFYTPESITKFLCQEALQESIKTTLNDKNILRFKILDNACGSGHFLIESLNAITKIVLESFDSFPSFKTLYEREKDKITQNITEYIPDYQIDESDIIKRLLLKRVIFGVDVNPFSIELSKLSLWIDSFIFGTPLSFLEHHIKCGNALIGTSIADFKQNTLAKSKGLFLQDLDSKFNALQEVFYKLDSIKDSTEIDIKESKRLYQDEILPTLTKLNLYLNYQNAKHFIKDPQERQSLLALQQAGLESLEQDKKAKELIESYAKTYRFFNYEIEFPEIVNGGVFIGFDIIIGNPPWDKTKFSDSDFFPQFISNYRTLSKSKKEEIKKNLLAKPYIKAQYEREKTFIQSVNDYYKDSYPLSSGSGDGNLFRFFVEKNLHLLAKNATLNYVLPSALMLEEGSLSLRKEILEHKRLNFFYSFENREGIFNDVHRSYKFALMQVQNTHIDSTHKIKTMFYKTNIDSVYDTNNIIETSLEEIATLSPSQLALQEVRDKKDLEILAKCYARFKPLSLEWLDFRRELDMTADKDLFIESFSDDLLPLYEGKMIHQFNAEFSEPSYFLDSTTFDKRLRSKEIHRLKQDLGINSKEYENIIKTLSNSQSVEVLEDSLICYDREFFRLGFRAVARDTDERTLIFSLLPKNVGFGHSMFANIPKRYIIDSHGTIAIQSVSHKRLLFALGIFNSLVVDYIARGMVQINVSKTYLERIPLPQPSDEELESKQDYAYIYKNALILQLYHDKAGDFEDLQKEFGIDKGQIPSTQKAYDTLRAKLDIHIAKLYGLSKEEFCAMLESFKVLHDKQAHYIALLKSLWE
ncbi:MAG TPA: N-6 DNA methylase [Campylobacter avium]|uniref:Eco57I restriction-modification methylase domain-containing protein n=1 Tax=Campylobacter avium TaxID=522485 RepID=UPI001E08EA4C|nr:N-6 DNA methylase [Campylobacter avium]HJE65596.1 N-6 DNA methylase [Campylobacter avium]